jgi:hypothetical protein
VIVVEDCPPIIAAMDTERLFFSKQVFRYVLNAKNTHFNCFELRYSMTFLSLTPKIPSKFLDKLGSFGHSWRNHFFLKNQMLNPKGLREPKWLFAFLGKLNSINFWIFWIALR